MKQSSLIGFSRGLDTGSCFQAMNPATGEKLSVSYIYANESIVNINPLIIANMWLDCSYLGLFKAEKF